MMKKTDTVEYIPFSPVAPGETLLEALEERGMSQQEFATRLGRPLKTVNGIVKGKVAITPETALQFEQVLGIPAHFWNAREAQYQELKLRIEARASNLSLIPIAKTYPYTDMAKWGWVPETKDWGKRVEFLLRYFGVTGFDNIVEEIRLQGAFRISEKSQYSMPAIVSWVRKGSVDAEQIYTQPFDIKKLKSSLPELRKLTHIEDPRELITKLQERLSECGIAFTVTPSLPKAPISGVTRWISPDKALIQMSLRWHWVDIFWFSFFHEIGHIILDNKKEFNVDLVSNKIDGDKEKEKDLFAANLLIPAEEYKKLLKYLEAKGNLIGVSETIKSFAKHIDVHPGIVVGRLQHDGKLPRSMNTLRIRFSFKK